jgi:predicted dehydrogenase
VSEPLRIGVVGCGSIARAHAAALRFVADDGLVRTVAAADPDPAGVAQFVAIAGDVAKTYDDGYALIADHDVDAVVLIVPTRFHRDYIAAVAEAGKPLFTEKPLAPTYPVVRETVDIVRSAGIPTQVGFQSRYQPLYRRARQMVAEREHGAPMAYMLRDDQFWPTSAVVAGHSDWRSQRSEAGGGALLEHSVHACDLLQWIFGPVRSVHAFTRAVFGYDVEDVAALTIEHDSGVVGTLVSVFNGVRHREERRLEVFLEGATVEITTDFVVGAPEDSFLVQERDDEQARRLDVARLRDDMWAADGLDPTRQVFVYQYFAHRAFALALQRGEPPTPGVEDALRAHQVVEAAYRSASRREPVELAELDTGGS